MQGILCLLYIITITSNVSGNFYQTFQEKSQNFSHNNLQGSRNPRHTSDFQNDKISSSKNFEENSIQDEIRKSPRPLNSIQDNNLNFLAKQYVRKKRHVGNEKQTKIKSSKAGRGKEMNLKTRKKQKQNNAEFKNNKKESNLKSKYKNENRPELIKRQTKRKFKLLSPTNAVINYLKNDPYSNMSENCRNEKNCQNSIHHRRRRKSHRMKNKKSRSRNNLRKKKSIYSQRACEAECSDRSFNSEPCHCRNEKPIDFENQLKILNKGGEKVETNNENPGILTGIQNFLKSDVTTLNPHQCSDATNKNSLNNNNNNINNGITSENNFETTTKVEIFPQTITEFFSETKKNMKFTNENVETTRKMNIDVSTKCTVEDTTEYNFEAPTEYTTKATNELDKKINCKLLPEEIFPQTEEIFSKTTNDFLLTNNLASGESDNKIFDCENNMESFNKKEDENFFHRTTETMTLVPTEEEIVDKTVINNFYNNPCFTTPVSNNYHELCNNDREEFHNFPSNNRNNKKPIATFSIIFKTNKMAKPKNFKFRLKY